MLINVECNTDERGEVVPSRISFDKRDVEVLEVVDCWYGEGYWYFKLRCANGRYILRHDEVDGQWHLVMFDRTDLQ